MPRKEKSIKIYEVAVQLSQELTGDKSQSTLPGIKKLGGPEFRFLLKKRLEKLNIKKGLKASKKSSRNVNSTGLKGCYIDSKNKFVVQISKNSKKHYLGKFDTIELAREARANFIKENNLKVLV